MTSRVLWMAALAVAAVFTVWAQGLVICRGCGREAKPGATACAHCSAPLPKPRDSEEAVKAPVAPVPDAGAEVSRLATSVVEDCVRQARELEAKQPGVALCYYQNALALMRLAPADRYPASVGAAILSGNERAMAALVRGQVTCRKCNGSGRFQLDMGKVDKALGIKSVDGVACPACKGAGSFAGFREVDKSKMAILQGRQEFERRQMVKGDVKVGRAYVPAALEKALTNRQRALVMTGMPLPCGDCQFAARQKCSSCKSTGWMKCTYSGCDEGFIKEARQGAGRVSKRLNEELIKKCPRCEGLAEIPCEVCKGQGNIACKTCDGSGLAARCKRCTGTGLTACSKCKGTGQVKEKPCPECKGENMMMCPSCRGEGALAR